MASTVATSFDQNRALLTAASQGNAGEILALLKIGAKVSIVDKDKETALMKAARYGHFQVVQLLIEREAEVDAVNKYKETALILLGKDIQK